MEIIKPKAYLILAIVAFFIQLGFIEAEELVGQVFSIVVVFAILVFTYTAGIQASQRHRNK